MNAPTTSSTGQASTVPTASHQSIPAAARPPAAPDSKISEQPAAPVVAAAADQDLAYVAWLLQRTAQTAEQAIGAAVAAGVEVPGWAGPAAWLYEYLAWTLTRQAGTDALAAAGLAGTDGPSSGPCWPAARTVSSGPPPSTAPPPVRARLGVHRCLACGRWGIRGFVAASPLLRSHEARTWRCADTGRCARRRTAREARRGGR